jgi:hypothetical protein
MLHCAVTGSANSKAMEVFYYVAFLTAMAGKMHTIREELILPAKNGIITILKCVTINGVWISELDLLITCIHHSELHFTDH